MSNTVYEFNNINGKTSLTINEDLSINLHLFKSAVKSLSMSTYLKVIKNNNKFIIFNNLIIKNNKFTCVFSSFKSSYLENYSEELHFVEKIQNFLSFKDLENRLLDLFPALNFKVENYNYIGVSNMCNMIEMIDDKEIDFVDKRRIVRKKTTVEE